MSVCTIALQRQMGLCRNLLAQARPRHEAHAVDDPGEQRQQGAEEGTTPGTRTSLEPGEGGERATGDDTREEERKAKPRATARGTSRRGSRQRNDAGRRKRGGRRHRQEDRLAGVLGQKTELLKSSHKACDKHGITRRPTGLVLNSNNTSTLPLSMIGGETCSVRTCVGLPLPGSGPRRACTLQLSARVRALPTPTVIGDASATFPGFEEMRIPALESTLARQRFVGHGGQRSII